MKKNLNMALNMRAKKSQKQIKIKRNNLQINKKKNKMISIQFLRKTLLLIPKKKNEYTENCVLSKCLIK